MSKQKRTKKWQLANKMMTPAERKVGISPFDCNAWLDRRSKKKQKQQNQGKKK